MERPCPVRAQAYGSRRTGRINSILREIAGIVRVLAGLPRRADSFISRAEQGRLEVRMPELKHHVARLERGVRKLAGSIIFAAGLVAGTELYLGGKTDAAWLSARWRLSSWVGFSWGWLRPPYFPSGPLDGGIQEASQGQQDLLVGPRGGARRIPAEADPRRCFARRPVPPSYARGLHETSQQVSLP